MKTQNTSLLLVVLLAMAILVLATAVVPALAQNPVPPTAREAATLPQFASRLHPSAPAAMNKPQASARAVSGRVSPQNLASCSDRSSPQCGDWIYDNGPANGTVDAWAIYSGYVVSDSFVYPGPGITWLYFYIWELPGDVLSSVQFSITSEPNGGTVYGSGTATYLGDDFISTNQYGYNVDIVSMYLGFWFSPSGTYWINLFNASARCSGMRTAVRVASLMGAPRKHTIVSTERLLRKRSTSAMGASRHRLAFKREATCKSSTTSPPRKAVQMA